MKRLFTIGVAALSLGLAGAAAAQPAMVSHTRVAPNGSVHTTTRVETPNGAEVRRTVDRVDGTRTVERTRTTWNDDHRSGWDHGHHYGWTRGHHYGWRHSGYRDRVCHTRWRHHERVRVCTTRHHHYD